MAEINLAPEDQFAKVKRQRQRRVFGWVGIVVLIMIVAWFTMAVLARGVEAELEKVEKQTSSLATELARLQDQADLVEGFSGRLAAMETLLAGRSNPSDILSEIERLTLPAMKVSTLSIDSETNTVGLDAVVETLDEVARASASFVNSEKNPTIFSGIDISNVTRFDVRNENDEVVSSTFEFSAVLSIGATN